ncbi:hypothetical protein [Agathobaculum desmolans]|uniref:hypothetical protein n=1 Tax=Agathobaculum desmolans TaxID=39484 RepID=UPI0004E26498|nr:hypothetical protein [Agathobaculum desmolans]
MARPVKEEYTMLREEIMESMKKQNELSIFISTTVCTFIGVVVALDRPNPFLYLIPFIILLPASFKESNYRRSIACQASYLIVFLENKDSFLWETRYQRFSIKHRSHSQRLRAILETLEFPLLGLLCSILFWVNKPIYFLLLCTSNEDTVTNMHLLMTFLLFFLPLFCIAIIAWNTLGYHNFRKQIQKNIIEWRQYKRHEMQHNR